MKIAAILTFFLFGCSNAFQDAQEINTIEAYDKFIAENSASRQVFDARMAIEKLMTEKARETQNPADFDAYLDKYEDDPPTPSLYNKIVDERLEAFWNKAEGSGTPEDWQAFINEYKDDTISKYMDTNRVRQAEVRLKIAEYATKLEIDPIKTKRVNLARDPEGPLNGWQLSTSITNSGRKDISHLNLAISFLDDEGNTIGSPQKFNVIGCGKYCDRGQKWVEENLFNDPKAVNAYPEVENVRPPFKRRSTRAFADTTGDTPPGWSGQVKATFVGIQFVERKR